MLAQASAEQHAERLGHVELMLEDAREPLLVDRRRARVYEARVDGARGVGREEDARAARDGWRQSGALRKPTRPARRERKGTCAGCMR